MKANSQTNEFFITRAKKSGQMELQHNDEFVGVFESEGAAADLAVRHAQDNEMTAYTIYYP